ncbi:hypothetical protein BH23GEM6_BH23GEM6_02040 [soil metagenome]
MKKIIRSACVLGILFLLGLAGAAGDLAAQDGTAYFVLRIGADTVAVERYERTATMITGRQLLRTPRIMNRDYTATLDAEGNATRAELVFSRPGDASVISSTTIDFGRDSAVVTVRQDDSTRVITVPAERGAIPFLGYSVGFYELPLAQHRGSGTPSSNRSLVPIGSRSAFDSEISSLEGDWITLTNIAGENRLRVDSQGRLLAWDGTGSTLKLEGERLTGLDFDALETSFSERERAGQVMGTLSPRDSVDATIGEATIRISYSRPSTRGRSIDGEVVPWNQVWRTGANQATQLSSDGTLLIGDVALAAGTYSLWTLPTAQGWTLIVNAQHGQWGTEYDQTQDAARIPMSNRPADSHVEQFTISVESDGGAGRLALAWGDVHVWVPLRAAP